MDKKIIVKWSDKNKEHYMTLGYLFTDLGKELEIHTYELSLGSRFVVEYMCDYCKGKHQNDYKSKHREFKVLIRCRKQGRGGDCCDHRECKEKKKIYIINKLNKNSGHKVYSKSIANKRIKTNLAKDSPKIAKQWHPTKNGFLTPDKVSNGTHKKVWWLCECGHEWEAEIHSRTISQSRCPLCNASKGEKKIAEYLQSNKIQYIFQYRFQDLIGINGKQLEFDFAIFNENNKMMFLIEYDGEYHYHKLFKTDGHEQLKINDEMKNTYCNNHNIELLRIPYFNFNDIENILSNYLHKFSICNLI